MGGWRRADERRLLIERAERLEEEKGISDDTKDVFAFSDVLGEPVSGLPFPRFFVA